jgi:hypothetical protein
MIDVFAHPVGADPFHLHELFVLAASGGAAMFTLAVVWIKIKGGKLLAGIRKLFRPRR